MPVLLLLDSVLGGGWSGFVVPIVFFVTDRDEPVTSCCFSTNTQGAIFCPCLS